MVEPGEETFLADLYQHEIGIFEEPVGGLDAVLASLPDELAALRRKKTEKARAAFRKKLAATVAEGRKAQHDGDPLLDIRSASLPELAGAGEERLRPPRRGAARRDRPPRRRADHRGGMEALREALVTLSRWLEEELEDLGTEVGHRVGIDVDTDQNVHPFEVAFTIGSGMRIEALPGMDMPDEPETFLGSFWRETAVARDELEWFATGHKLVEALVGLVRDGDAGRLGGAEAAAGPRAAAACTPRFELVWATAADAAPGRPGRLAPGLPLPGRRRPSPCMVDLEAAPAGHRRRGAAGGGGRRGRGRPRRPGAAGGRSRRPARRRSAEAEAELDAGARRRRWRGSPPRPPAEEERLIEAGFEGGADKDDIDSALAASASTAT